MIVFATAAAAATHILDDTLIAAVNMNPKSTWRARRSPRFEGITLSEGIAMLNNGRGRADVPPTSTPAAARSPSPNRVPTNFDSRTEWPNCIHAIRDQGSCGGCWAFAASEVLSDRFCIASNEKTNVVLSPQDLISCDVGKYTFGCGGGVPEYAWKYLTATGISSDACIPFIGNATEACPVSASCDTKKFLAKAGSVRLLGSDAVEGVQQDMVAKGPVQADFDVYQDFFAYSSGIYSCPPYNRSKVLGRHSIKLVGYGQDNTTEEDYWIVANSWGPTWGLDGFFKIRANSNECNIENEMIFGDAQLAL